MYPGPHPSADPHSDVQTCAVTMWHTHTHTGTHTHTYTHTNTGRNSTYPVKKNHSSYFHSFPFLSRTENRITRQEAFVICFVLEWMTVRLKRCGYCRTQPSEQMTLSVSGRPTANHTNVFQQNTTRCLCLCGLHRTDWCSHYNKTNEIKDF